MTGILVSGNPRENQRVFSRSTMRNHFPFLVLFSKHEIDRNIYSRSRAKKEKIFIQISREDIILGKFENITDYFFKYMSTDKQLM